MGWQDVAPSDEIEAADWIRRRLHPFAQDVGAVVPTGFEAYARVFHPAWMNSANLSGPPAEVRWSEIAEATGRTVHPEMQFHAIARSSASPLELDPRIQEPRLGVLSERQIGELTGLLSRHTTTPDACWLCLWDGYGHLGASTGLAFSALRVRLPGRDHLIFRGSVADARGWEEGPNLWWPDDRAWCVASEIDFPYTYIGGTRELVEEILAHPGLESLPATVADGIWATSDTINS
jgi:hypothetical protein